jgi:hypothetical protein
MATFSICDISIDEAECVDWASIFNNNDGAQQQQQPSPHKMANLHKIGGVYGSHRMAVRGQPGIRAVEIACRRGTASKIARFFETYLDCNVVQLPVVANEDDDSNTNAAIISVGPGVQIVFIESINSDNDSNLVAQHEQMKGVHICIYISNFASAYNTLQDHNLIWTNPRFVHLDTCDTWEEACASRTLRFRDIVDVDNGEKIMELEFETRPMMHGQYLKVPRYIPN